jgi:AraC family transcriptional regulator of adaptative response/methylated-DNA-[protein]-cysteine methyltransferase
MSEHIRYAWGQSSLGEFIAARSEQGLVAFEFSDKRDETIERLRARFPGALIQEDDEALRGTVDALSAVVDHPERPSDLALDIRGTGYQKRVWELLCQIPAGTTTHYGAIAAQLGTRDAREVTEAIASNSIAILIPCHRVVKKDGSLSGYRGGVRRKRALLTREQRASEFKLS